MRNLKSATGAMECHMTMRVSPAMRSYLGKEAGPAGRRLAMLVTHDETIEGLARALKQGLDEATSPDGRIDFKAMAAKLIETMKEHQR